VRNERELLLIAMPICIQPEYRHSYLCGAELIESRIYTRSIVGRLRGFKGFWWRPRRRSGDVSLSCACTSWHKYAHLSPVVHQGHNILDIIAFVSKIRLHTPGKFLSGCLLCKVSSKIAVTMP
jgi:hypothetical protein